MRYLVVRKFSEMVTTAAVGTAPDTALGAVPDTRKKKKFAKQVFPGDRPVRAFRRASG